MSLGNHSSLMQSENFGGTVRPVMVKQHVDS